MRVINAVVFNGNPYNSMLYAHPVPRYQMVPGSIADALAAQARDARPILHLQWEEGFLRKCGSADEADATAADVLQQLRLFVDRGGILVWTVHNEFPHEDDYPDAFLALRRGIAPLSAAITVHSPAAVPILLAQCEADPARIVHIPHPSYLGVYEPEAETLAEEPDWEAEHLLFLGKLRRYKGLDLLVEAMWRAPGVPVDVVGEPQPDDTILAELARAAAALPELRFMPGRVEDAELPGLLRACRGVVLPYRRFLTSGVAALATSFGRPVIAPDVEQMREALPASLHRLLFQPGDAESLALSMRMLAALGRSECAAMRAALLEKAVADRPAVVSSRLFDLFDRLRRAA